jgi:hypothetical protein
MAVEENTVRMREMIDPVQRAEAGARCARLERNWVWFEAHASEVYARHRGKCICIAGEELFVADTAEEVLAQAAAAHPEDDGRFTRYVPREKVARIYAHQGSMASLMPATSPKPFRF